MQRLQGMALPRLVLPATGGGAVDLAAIEGPAVLYLYPWTGRPGVPNPPGWDDIPGAHGSTPEAEGFRDLHADFEARGVTVLGLSTQPTAWQEELAARLRLPFRLLSDEAFALQEALGLPTFETGGVAYLVRLTLLVEGQRVERAFHPVRDPPGHAREVLGTL